MTSTTVRVSVAMRDVLRELAGQTGESMQSVLERAIEEYRRRLFFEQVNAAYQRLRDDPEAWREEVEEQAIFEGTLADGLDEE